VSSRARERSVTRRGEAPRLVVVAAHRTRHARARPLPPRRRRPRPAPAAPAPPRGQDARAAEDHDGRFDALFLLHQLGLEQFELHAHRAQFLAQQEAVSVKARR
jgi:hypothetical protein